MTNTLTQVQEHATETTKPPPQVTSQSTDDSEDDVPLALIPRKKRATSSKRVPKNQSLPNDDEGEVVARRGDRVKDSSSVSQDQKNLGEEERHATIKRGKGNKAKTRTQVLTSDSAPMNQASEGDLPQHTNVKPKKVKRSKVTVTHDQSDEEEKEPNL